MTEEERKKDHENTKLAVGVTLAVVSLVCPPAAAIGLTAFTGAAGAGMCVAGKATDDNELTESGKSFLEPTVGKAAGDLGIFGGKLFGFL